MHERRFFKRYLTFWHLYNLFADFFFLVSIPLNFVSLEMGMGITVQMFHLILDL